MTKEQLKSLALVALFGLCTVLVSQIWSEPATTDMSSPSDYAFETKNNKRVLDYIHPQRYIYNFGGDLRAVDFYDKDGLWGSLSNNLLGALASKDVVETELSGKEWWNKNQYRSIRFQMPFEITADEFLEAGLLETKYTGKMKRFDMILFNISDPKHIYLGSGTDNLYYKISSSNVSLYPVEQELSKMQNTDIVNYLTMEEAYNLKNYLGEKSNVNFIENRLLVPRVALKPIQEVEFEYDSFMRKKEKEVTEEEKKVLEKVFGKQLAFIKRMEDVNNSIIYQYGYNERTMKIKTNGELLYHENPKQSSYSQTTMIQALGIAVEFLNTIKAENVDKDEYKFYLKRYTPPNSERGYIFEFTYLIDEYPVLSKNDDSINDMDLLEAPMTVEVKGKQVLECKRYFVEKQSYTETSHATLPSLDAIVLKNLSQIIEHYEQGKGTNLETAPKNLHQMLQLIKSTQIAYYILPDEKKMVPVWEIDFSGVRLCFSLYDGELIAKAS